MFRNIFVLIFSVLVFASGIEAHSQVKGMPSGTLDKEDLLKQQKPDINFNSLIEQDKMPIGNIVDPKYYYMGPGDIISLQVMPIIPYEYPLMVSPDMTLILPRGGEIDVRDLSLADLKDTLEIMFKSRNPNAEVYLTLKKSRVCIVTISGNVLFPGTYSLPSSYRVSTAIKFANHVTNEKTISEEDKLSIQRMQGTVRDRSKNFSESGISMENLYSNRNITLLRKPSGSQTVDIEKANATLDLNFDPFIKEGDEIFVPYEPYHYPKLSISGAIHRPAVVLYKSGDKLSELVKFAYGINEYADLSNVRLFMPGREPVKIAIDQELNLISEDMELIAGSSVIIGRAPEEDFENLSVVSVRGQVHHPGIYPINAGQTRLRDVVDYAGGFTDKAYLPLSYIIRRDQMTDAFVDYRRDFYQTFQYSDLTLEDTSRFTIDMMLKKPIVSCDFVKAFREGSDIDNVVLRDGDVIMVPDNPGYVYVYGQVNHPGYVEYREGKNMSWYIEKAGGYAQGAAKKRARIIKGKSKVWSVGGDLVLVNAGDEVYVPRPPDIPLSIEWQKYGTIASLVSVSVAVIGTIFNIYWLQRSK